MHPNRIVILGNAGSGKSTLARKLGQTLHLPVIHLDTLFWGPNWTQPEPEPFRERVRDAIKSERWICEGNYARTTFDLRLPRADLVIELGTPRITCLRRVIWRSLTQPQRPDLPIGCTERIDHAYFGFLRYVWNFDRDTRPMIDALRQNLAPQIPVVHLNGKSQIDSFLANHQASVET